MSDLVQRLRAPRPRPGYDEPLPPHPWMVEAADRIAQLEAAIREAQLGIACGGPASMVLLRIEYALDQALPVETGS
jgi:hypothetical protein